MAAWSGGPNTSPDGNTVITTNLHGRPLSVTRLNSTNGPLGQTLYGYDAHDRLWTSTDARNGVTTYGYDDADRLTAVTTPSPGNGQPAQTTTTEYDVRGRAWRIVQPDGGAITNVYYPSGELFSTYGSRTYPVSYDYDTQGRMTTMTNWSDAGELVTTWQYDAYRGFVTNKLYPGAVQGPSYDYTPAGRLQTRLWARGNPRIATAYSYNAAGELSGVTYTNGPTVTTNLTYLHDRRGRLNTVVQGNLTTTRHYHDANLLIGESYSGGMFGGLAITNTFDASLRRTGLSARKDTSTLASAAFGYDSGSRLSTVTDGSWNSTYAYLANSPLVGQITHKLNSDLAMTDTRQYDLLNRLTRSVRRRRVRTSRRWASLTSTTTPTSASAPRCRMAVSGSTV